VDKELLTPQKVARLLGVSPVTVRQWASQGWLKAQRTAGQHRRFDLDEVRRFARERGLVLGDAPRNKSRVLIVEDDRQLVEYLIEMLGDFARLIEVRTAYDGFEAGRITASWHPDFILLDLMLPGIDGFELCKRFKRDADTAGIRVIAMTGFFSDANAVQIVEAGAERCLAKPFRRQELLDALELGDCAGQANETRT
jgi:excisionase family DNA binding protein